MAFQKEGDEYAGIAFDNRTFGNRNSGLLSVYVNGKQYRGRRSNNVVQYIGLGIAINEREKEE